MTETSRSSTMARVRQASLGLSTAEIAADLESLGLAPSAALPASDIVTAFMCNVVKNQGTIDLANGRTEIVQSIGDYIYQRYHTHKIVAANNHRLAALPWREAGVLPRFGAAEDGDAVAVSYARLGVAETGSVVCFTGKANPGVNNLLPQDHVVLIDAADLMATLEQAWERIEQDIIKEGRPRGINFISGPSSTADIEAELILGAHGPSSWHVIVVGDMPKVTLETARQLAAH